MERAVLTSEPKRVDFATKIRLSRGKLPQKGDSAGVLGGEVTAADLIGLPKYCAYVRLMIDGVAKLSCSMETIPPIVPDDPMRATIVREQSRRRYAQPLAKVRASIERVFVANAGVWAERQANSPRVSRP